MEDLKTITALTVVTDTESAHVQIGDICGGTFDPQWLKDHVAAHGPFKLALTFAYMMDQVVQACSEVSQGLSNELLPEVLQIKSAREQELHTMFVHGATAWHGHLDSLPKDEGFAAEPVTII